MFVAPNFNALATASDIQIERRCTYIHTYMHACMHSFIHTYIHKGLAIMYVIVSGEVTESIQIWTELKGHRKSWTVPQSARITEPELQLNWAQLNSACVVIFCAVACPTGNNASVHLEWLLTTRAMMVHWPWQPYRLSKNTVLFTSYRRYSGPQ